MDMSRGSLAVWRKTLHRDVSVAADQEEGREGDGQRTYVCVGTLGLSSSTPQSQTFKIIKWKWFGLVSVFRVQRVGLVSEF